MRSHVFSTLTPTNSRTARPASFRSHLAFSVFAGSSIENKPRLYIALCPRYSSATYLRTDANCDSHHWSILVGGQSSSRASSSTRYHIEHAHGMERPYLYVEDDAQNLSAANAVTVRVAVAKVVDTARLQTILREAPIVQDDISWNCLNWVREGFERLVSDGQPCVKGYVGAGDWNEIEKKTRAYANRKRHERRGTGDTIPTFNYWENRETSQ